MGINVAAFDIECTSLNGDFGIILCAVIHPQGGKPITIRGDKLVPNWHRKRSDDSLVAAAIAEELSKYDLLIAHNGVMYDLPFIRTRIAKANVSRDKKDWIAPLPKLKIIDPVKIARMQLRMSSNSLHRVTDFLNCNSKTEVSGDLWMKAALDGDKKAMEYIVEHCLEDVKMLYSVLDHVKGYCSAFNNMGSMF